MSKKTIAKGYYAVFEYSSDAVDVFFPGLEGCLTFGKDMEDAYESAVDVLAGWLEHADEEYIPEKKLTFKELEKKYTDEVIMLVPVDTNIMKKYEEKQRFNASFPKSILKRVDEFALAKGWNRSQFLIKAAEKVIADDLIS